MKTIGNANINNKYYLIQYLRKSSLNKNNTNLAEYVNNILRSFSNGNNKNLTIKIYGSCWGRKDATNQNLIQIIFKNISKAINIELCNSYPRFTSNNIAAILKTNGYNTITQSNNGKDHAKIIEIFYKKKKIFFMIGSSNFSANSYIIQNNIDQCEIAFIQKNKFTNNLITNIVYNQPEENQNLLEFWLNNLNNESDNYINIDSQSLLEIEYFKNNIFPTFPYVSDKNNDII